MRSFAVTAAFAAFLISSAPASAAPTPQPLKPVDLSRYYGRWYEVARLHNRIEEHCARSTADYVRNPDGNVTAIETCRHDNDSGTSIWRAKVTVVDPGRNTKLRLTFFPFVSREYWVLDHADDYSWAVVSISNGDGKYLWLFSRSPQASTSDKASMIAHAQTLGYDTSRLIYDR